MENLIGIKLGVLRWCHSRVEAGEREMSPGRDTSSSFLWALVRELLSVGPCPLALPRFILNVMGDGSLPGDALSLMHHPPGTVLSCSSPWKSPSGSRSPWGSQPIETNLFSFPESLYD